MRYVLILMIFAGAAGPVLGQATVDDAKLNALAQEWLGRAESGDLIPAWNVQEPPLGIPQAYDLAPPVIKETTRKCRLHYEKERRDLLVCLEAFGAYHREDTPRAQLKLPVALPMPIAAQRPPVARVQVR